MIKVKIGDSVIVRFHIHSNSKLGPINEYYHGIVTKLINDQYFQFKIDSGFVNGNMIEFNDDRFKYSSVYHVVAVDQPFNESIIKRQDED